jgi:hypothetical protein
VSVERPARLVLANWRQVGGQMTNAAAPESNAPLFEVGIQAGCENDELQYEASSP